VLRWLGRNLRTLLLAFVLALFVWFAALLAADPNEESVFPKPVPIDVVGLDADMLLIEAKPQETQITLIAPKSIWSRLLANPDLVHAWIDLTGLEEGEHIVPVQAEIKITPARIQKVDPGEVSVVLEHSAEQTFPVKIEVTGDVSVGYRKGTPTLEPTKVVVSGSASHVAEVAEVHAALDVSGADSNVSQIVPVRAYDASGSQITNVTITPAVVQVDQPVTLLGGYRNVVVKVVTRAQVADGYWLTNVSVSPPNVTVFSADPEKVIALPGYVETNPLDLTGLNDDVDIRATLNLPEGVSLAGEESVLVRLSIAALEGSLPISLPVEIVGLSPEYQATVSPEAVELLLIGPLPILNNLNPAGLRVSVNVSGLEPGVYQVEPVVDLLPSQVKVASMLPQQVEVTISPAPTATITPRVTSRPVTVPTLTPTP
jgi:YbbR domain-containing protein